VRAVLFLDCPEATLEARVAAAGKRCARMHSAGPLPLEPGERRHSVATRMHSAGPLPLEPGERRHSVATRMHSAGPLPLAALEARGAAAGKSCAPSLLFHSYTLPSL
jgi:hypothetical protein